MGELRFRTQTAQYTVVGLAPSSLAHIVEGLGQAIWLASAGVRLAGVNPGRTGHGPSVIVS